MKQTPPKEIYAAYEGEDDGRYISAGAEPADCSIGIDDKKIVGRYVLVETMEVDYRLNITARQTVEAAQP